MAQQDPRVSYDPQLEAYIFRGDDHSEALLWDEEKKAWFPLVRSFLGGGVGGGGGRGESMLTHPLVPAPRSTLIPRYSTLMLTA